MTDKNTIADVQNKKGKEKIVMVTAYDFPTGKLVDQAGVDMILVGDSLANVVLGLDATTEVDIEIMLHHARAVNRGVKKAVLVGDMPYASLHNGVGAALRDAARFVKEAGCQAVKVEWFEDCLFVTEKIIQAGIPVMGHVGLTPQTADQLGGMKVQGKDAESAKRIIQSAKDLEKQGCFAIVLECVPDKISEIISQELSIPTIGIGAGAFCDGQVLVLHDLIGLFDGYRPKFVKRYVQIDQSIEHGVRQFSQEVRDGNFPAKEHSFTIRPEELDQLKK